MHGNGGVLWPFFPALLDVTGISADGMTICGNMLPVTDAYFTGGSAGQYSVWVATVSTPVTPEPVPVVSGKAIMNPIMSKARKEFTFVVYGRVAASTSESFDLTDGSGQAVTVLAPGHSADLGYFVSARGTVDNTTNPPKLISTPADVTIISYF